MGWDRLKSTHLALLAALLSLSGCMGPGPGPFAATKGDGAHAPAAQKVLGGKFTVAGPRGYCVDEGATRDDGDGGFVLLGSCSAISGNPRDAKPRKPAVLTASVTPAASVVDDAALDRMAAFFATDEGRAALARAEGGGPVEVLDLRRPPGLVLVHAADREPAQGMAGDYWRGVFEAPGALVTVTVSGFAAAPLSDKDGRALAKDFVAAIRAANGAAAPVVAAGSATPAGGLAGVLGRLF